MTGRVTLTVNGDLAHVSIDNPPVNALSQALRKGLMEALADLKDQTGVKAVILCCTGRSFVAGADIRELGQTPVEPFLPDVVAAIEASSVPWIAALHGKVLGGGLELAMACHGRVAVMSAKLGLPEVTLGILPGAGGTVRLPRLVPMADAIALVTSGKTIAVTQAHSIGLVDCLVEDDLIAGAETLALRLATQGTPRPTLLRDLIPGAPIDWAAQETSLRKQSRGAAAPLEALAALRFAAEAPAAEALPAECARFLRLAASPEAAALRHIFFAERAVGKGLQAEGATPADLSRVRVIGGGTMGAGIATALLLSGSQVHLIERDASAVTTARGRVTETLAASIKRGVLSQDKADAALASFSCGDDYAALTSHHLVIEAVFEDMAVKQRCLRGSMQSCRRRLFWPATPRILMSTCWPRPPVIRRASLGCISLSQPM